MSFVSPRSLGRLATAVVVGAAGVAIAVPANAAEGDTVSRGLTIPVFYNPPQYLPADNGALVRSEPMKIGLTLPGLDGKTMPGTATRVMFKSTDMNGKPVAVTGAYIEPSAKWKGSGPRPLIVQASGTMGQGDQCAPSLALEKPLAINLDPLGVSVGYENIAAYRLLAKGIGVMVTDYVGLGTTDRTHTYVGRIDQGHAVLDAARAALKLPNTSLTNSSKIGLYGYSQGGGATGSAAEFAASYAPELKISGAYVGAPPADLTKVMTGIDGSALAVALAWTINGMAENFPDLAPILDKYLSEKGAKVFEDAKTLCVGDGLIKYAFTKSSSLTKQGYSLAEILKREPAVRAVVEDQRIGKVKPSFPVRVSTGPADDSVPHGQARQLAVDWCKLGGNVTYKPILLPNLGDKVVLTNHFLPLIADQGDALDWITDRVSGKSTGNNCLFLPLMP